MISHYDMIRNIVAPKFKIIFFCDSTKRHVKFLKDTSLKRLPLSLQAVIQNMKVTCKCHGVSGSCSLITCWQQLAPFRKVGDHLQDKYGLATRVKTTRSGRLRVRRKASNIPTANDLVFLHRSPNYCHVNGTIGSLGEFSLFERVYVLKVCPTNYVT